MSCTLPPVKYSFVSYTVVFHGRYRCRQHLLTRLQQFAGVLRRIVGNRAALGKDLYLGEYEELGSVRLHDGSEVTNIVIEHVSEEEANILAQRLWGAPLSDVLLMEAIITVRLPRARRPRRAGKQ